MATAGGYIAITKISLALILFTCGRVALAVDLQPATVSEFNEHVAAVEKQLDAGVKSGDLLWVDDSADRLSKVKAGDILVENWKGDRPIKITGGEINDFIGAVLVPGKSIDDVLAVMKNYARYKDVFRPEVVDSRVISEDGDTYRVYLKYVKKFVMTVGYDTEHEIRYIAAGDGKVQSRSRTTKVVELADVGTPNEKRLPEGKDSGFLWKMYSYYNFQAMDGGVVVECRAITLSAPLPVSLSWMASTIQLIPKQSLAGILEAIRKSQQ